VNNKPLLWEQGLFLQPQHFQMEYTRMHTALATVGSMLHPYFWGIDTIEINEAILNNGMLEIVKLDLMSPDGAHISFPDNAELAPRAFRNAWANPEKPLMVYLALAPFSATGDNVFLTDSPHSAPAKYRFTAKLNPERVPDLYGTGPDADIRTMHYALRILVGNEEENDAVIRIPVARLMLQGEYIVLDKHYIPPSLNVKQNEHLYRMGRDVRDTLLSRCHQLEEYKITITDSAFNGVSTLQGMTLFSILSVLSRNVPELAQYLELPRLHPWDLYLLLCRLVGELSIFTSALSPLGETPQGERMVRTYDHCNLFECFSLVHSIILRLVDTLVIGPAYTFILEEENAVYRTRLPQDACGTEYSYWLLLRSTDKAKINAQAPILAKLVPESDLHNSIAQALPGVRLQLAAQPPAGLPRREDTVYLQIDSNNALWQKIMSERSIAFVFPGCPQDMLAQLAVVQR
jgi:type VI secretion system protein ImpJ